MSTLCRAMIMGDRSGADGTHRFELKGNLMQLPADEVVEQFMGYLYDTKFLSGRYGYELNAALRVADKNVVMATVPIKEHRLPFTIMISDDDEG